MKLGIKVFIFALLIGCLEGLFSCGSQDAGFQKTADGLSYKFYAVHPENAVPSVSDYLKLRMDYYLNDSLVYSSSEMDEYPRIQFQKPKFGGDILTGFGMMHEGDSASFIVRADSTIFYMFGVDSMSFQPDDFVRFDVKLLQIQSETAFEKELDSMVEMHQQMEEMMHDMKAQSETELIQYLRSQGVNDEVSDNKVFIIPIKLGDGPKVSVGMKAFIKYDAYLLDGTYLGSSDSLDGSHYEVPVGQGKVLKGLDEGLAHMSKGEKAKIVVPYALAYGESGYESIPPFTNLLFVVEVMDLVQ